MNEPFDQDRDETGDRPERGPDERAGTQRAAEGRAELAAIEAVLVVATEPVPAGLLAELLERPVERVEELLSGLGASYAAEGRGFEVVAIAGGWRLQSHPAYRGYVERFILDDAPHRLSPAALETLAIVAYKQPISRAQVAAIRGVNADGVMRLLSQRGYIAQVGRDEGPGQAVLFGTTPLFLERLGLAGIDELPPLQDFVPDAGTVELLEQVLRTGPAATPADDPREDEEAEAGPDEVSPEP
ncbi:MAG: SMC-Scp complex subunit ScpB [Actinomycetota bacterium]|nr:SMC-Scp complex subunit ScpB [Actinomycetota bacterium]